MGGGDLVRHFDLFRYWLKNGGDLPQESTVGKNVSCQRFSLKYVSKPW